MEYKTILGFGHEVSIGSGTTREFELFPKELLIFHTVRMHDPRLTIWEMKIGHTILFKKVPASVVERTDFHFKCNPGVIINLVIFSPIFEAVSAAGALEVTYK